MLDCWRPLSFGGSQKYEAVLFGKKHIKIFAAHSRVSDCLKALAVPSTLLEYADRVSLAGRLVTPVRDATYGKSYGFLWLCRAYLLAELHARGKHLTYRQKDTVSCLNYAFPDQCSWVSRFVGNTESTRVSTLVRLLKYKDPLEMLTCDLCIFGGGARRWALEDIANGKNEVQRLRKQFSKDEPPNPLVLIADATRATAQG